MLASFGQAAAAGGDPAAISGQAMAVVLLTIGVLAALSWLLRRGRRRAPLAVAVETAIPLGERRSLLIVTVEGRRLLLGLTPVQITLVTELARPFHQTLDTTIGTVTPP
jgi:flagellar biogenesis protein FliO